MSANHYRYWQVLADLSDYDILLLMMIKEGQYCYKNLNPYLSMHIYTYKLTRTITTYIYIYTSFDTRAMPRVIFLT
jgi:hypothetical protein